MAKLNADNLDWYDAASWGEAFHYEQGHPNPADFQVASVEEDVA